MSKGLEALQEMRRYGAVMIPNCEIIEKELKALEIIKNKNFDLFYLRDSKDLESYNDACDYFRNLSYLTQEEYDLLREVLK